MSDQAPHPYAQTANELTRRILALIPDHPEIMTLESPFDLFRIEGFKCDDIGPSLAQAMHSIAAARHIYTQQQGAKTDE